MRFNKLDLNLLVALDAMFRLRSVSRAAEQLHMSQSALSSSLARLRDYFGDELLVPVGRRMELTPRAIALAEAVREVLVRVDTTITAVPHFDPAQSDREFRIFVSDFSMVVLVPHLLALAREQSAGVRFRLLPQTRQPQRMLEHGDADLLVAPRKFCSAEHPVDALFEEDFCVVVWRHSRYGRAGAITLAEYKDAGHVVMQPSGMERTFENRFMDERGIRRRVEVDTFSFLAAPFLVAGTERVATVHRRLAREVCRGLEVVVLAVPLPMERMEQAMQWHKYRTQDPGLVWLRALLHRAVARMDAGAA